MRLLYILGSFPFSGEKEEFFFPEIDQLAKDGNEVVIVPRIASGDLIPEARTLDLDWQLLQPLVSLPILKGFILELAQNPKGIWRVVRLVSQSKGVGDLTKNVLVIPKAAWLAREARGRKVEHIHVHWATTTATLALLTSELTGIPWSLSAHRGDIVANNLLELKLKTASFVRFISNSGIQLARERTNLQPDAKWKMIRMGVQLDPGFSVRKHPENSPPVVLCPAGLVPVKGHTYLIHAIAQLKRGGLIVKLLLAGDGPTRIALRQLVNELSVAEAVEFLGHLPQGKLFELYRSGGVDLVVVPSVDLGGGEQEGVPVSLLEAMAYGIPTISTRTGGIPESLGEGECLLVQDKNPDALADAIKRILQNKELRNEIVLRGHKKVIEEFDVRVVSKKLEECFRCALAP